MNQAHNFEVAGRWEFDRIRTPVDQRAGVHTGGAIEDGLIGRRPWTARAVGRPHLAWLEERYRMNLTRRKGPGNAIPGVNPKLIGQECLDLYCLIEILGARERLPGRGLDCL